jgi:hypothetical protein
MILIYPDRPKCVSTAEIIMKMLRALRVAAAETVPAQPGYVKSRDRIKWRFSGSIPPVEGYGMYRMPGGPPEIKGCNYGIR